MLFVNNIIMCMRMCVSVAFWPKNNFVFVPRRRARSTDIIIKMITIILPVFVFMCVFVRERKVHAGMNKMYLTNKRRTHTHIGRSVIM